MEVRVEHVCLLVTDMSLPIAMSFSFPATFNPRSYPDGNAQNSHHKPAGDVMLLSPSFVYSHTFIYILVYMYEETATDFSSFMENFFEERTSKNNFGSTN